MFGRAFGLILLIGGVLRTILRRFLRTSSLSRFERDYGSEGLRPVQEKELVILHRATGCIACGRCDVHEGPRIAAGSNGYQGMMYFVLSGTRSMPNYDAIRRSLHSVPEAAFTQAERVCPTGVPLTRLSHLIRSWDEKRSLI